MERLPIPATKSNAIRLKDELALARDGRQLLDQKKDILINHINLLAGKADQARRLLDKALLDAYDQMKLALIESGRARMEAAGLAVDAGLEVTIRERSLMGVVLPLVSINKPKFRPEYSLAETTRQMDRVREMILSATETMAELAEVEVGLKRLMEETKRTLKRINALSYIYIPVYEATLKSIEERLEEKEREALFQLKRVKGKAEKSAGI